MTILEKPTYARKSVQANKGRNWPKIGSRLLLVALAAGVVAVIALISKLDEKAKKTEHPAIQVTVERVQPTPELEDSFTLSGVVQPARVVTVSAEVAGRIERWGERPGTQALSDPEGVAPVTIREGETIEPGQPLIYLNRDLLIARRDQAEAQFDYDQRELGRIQSLFDRNLTSQTELDNARSRRDASKAVLEGVAHELERTAVVAPIEGVLNDIFVEVGEYAVPGTPVAEIVDLSKVKVAVDISERDIHYLSKGQKANIEVSAPESTTLVGEITYMSELADPQTRTTRVEITVDNRDGWLRSGQIVRARLVRRVLHNVIMIPLQTVIPLEEGYVVYVAVDGVAERRPVKLGILGLMTQVEEGLKPGDTLIVEGQRLVGPGQSVSIVE